MLKNAQNRFQKSTSTLLFWLAFALSSAVIQSSSIHLAYSADLDRHKDVSWKYDAGPDPKTPEGREWIKLYAEIPYFPGMSDEIRGAYNQLFRSAFAATVFRGNYTKNSIQILFGGQDPTHAAEGAGYPATAGFGGRAQNLAEYFGVRESAAFINAFAFTIKGQYSPYASPMIVLNEDGTPKELKTSSFTENDIWLMSQDPRSEIVQWRNRLIDQIIKNNPDSLKMIVSFGGAASDAWASYLESKGAQVESRTSLDQLKRLKIPVYKAESTGGNNQAQIPLTTDGKDLYEAILGRKLNYKPKQGTPEAETDIYIARKTLKENLAEWYPKIKFRSGGLENSGIIHPAQIGGRNLDAIWVNGEKTISLNGLKISDELTISRDLLVTSLPHPTALTNMEREGETGPEKVATLVANETKSLRQYSESGEWHIEPELGLKNSFELGEKFKYSHSDVPDSHYGAYTPATRRLSYSTAQRDGPDVIGMGSRDRITVDQKALNSAKNSTSETLTKIDQPWNMYPTDSETLAVFDRGPSEKYGRLLKDLPEDVLTRYLKHEGNGDFAHYRGTFNKPEVLILADPYDVDDLFTSKAFSGSRGQYYQGLMEDLGVGDQYLVLQTAPFIKNPEDWDQIIEKTKTYRENLIQAVFADGTPKLIIADGETAASELNRIYTQLYAGKAPAPSFVMNQSLVRASAGIVDTGKAIQKFFPELSKVKIRGKMADIPRSHLHFATKWWVGKGGDHVVMAQGVLKEIAYEIVVPQYVMKQKYKLPPGILKNAQYLASLNPCSAALSSTKAPPRWKIWAKRPPTE